MPNAMPASRPVMARGSRSSWTTRRVPASPEPVSARATSASGMPYSPMETCQHSAANTATTSPAVTAS